jgi:hypothetical protein
VFNAPINVFKKLNEDASNFMKISPSSVGEKKFPTVRI